MKKKILSIFLGGCLLLTPMAFAACEGSGEKTPSVTDSDITDLPAANVAVTVEEYPSLSYDTSEDPVTDPSIAQGTLTVSYSAEEKLTLYMAKDSIVTASEGETYVANGRRYNTYSLTAKDAGEYSLYFVTEEEKLAEAFDWTVARAYPYLEELFDPLAGFGAAGTPSTGVVNAHDPSIIEVDGVYYTFGTDNYGQFGYTIRSSRDLINWERVGVAIEGFNEDGSRPTTSTFSEENELYPIYELLSTVNDWKNTWTLWAPNVVPAADGGYWLYGSWTAGFGSSHSIIFQCYAEEVTGPYELVYVKDGVPSTVEEGDPAVLVFSHDGGESLPNGIDPFVYYDQEGNMYLAYGSFSGGIWHIELDPETGLRKDKMSVADICGTVKTAAERYGSCLVANCNTEGPTISYHKGVEVSSYDGTGTYNAEESTFEDRYYLMTSSGALASVYNMRSYYSTSANGPFAAAHGGINGSRVSGSFSWRTGKDASKGHAGFNDWFVPGHNDMFVTDEGDNMLVFHVRNEFSKGENNNHFQVQTLYAFNSRGEIVMNPNRYAGERLRKVTAAEIYTLTEGAYSFAYVTNDAYASSYNGGYAMKGLELREDKKIYFNDSEVGTWVLYGDNYVLLDITTGIPAATGGQTLSGKFFGVAFPAQIEEFLVSGISISCVSVDGQNCLYLNMDFGS